MSEPAPHPRATPTWLGVLMILLGVILLLPGACAAFFMVIFMTESPSLSSDSTLIPLWLVCFVIAAGGIVIIWSAVKRLRHQQ